jgi:uncharacterized glyoxalase superfamily protein PhnB
MKPQKFIRCSPHLPVKNLKDTLDYYRNKLGFYEEWTWKDKDGGIQRDDMRLLFAEDPEFVDVISSYKKSRLPLIWFVNNIEAIFEEFKNRNIEIASALQTHPYGLREFAFIDINGYYIRVAERTEE